MRSTRPTRTRDHPRSRGVYGWSGRCSPTGLGSSPLARGLLWWAGMTTAAHGIIPARAGFTARGGTPWMRTADHPRSRGVYAEHSEHSVAVRGSSPLARGLHAPIRGYVPLGRIIPARAGFTRRDRRRRPRPGDHPRSRGVYSPSWGPAGTGSGSSPLARGLLPIELNEDGSLRIIPARAGFTRRRGSEGRSPRDHPRSRGVYAALAGVQVVSTVDHPRSRGVYNYACQRR